MKQSLDQDALQTLLSTRTLRDFRACRHGAGWALEGRLGTVWLPVRSKRLQRRVWLSLTALGRFCESMGIQTLVVEL